MTSKEVFQLQYVFQGRTVDEQSIFLQALNLSPGAQRDAWLDEACGGDPAFRQRIDALLRTHGQAANFLEQPACESEATIMQEAGGDARVQSLEAGLTAAFRGSEAVVVGGAGHSVLKALGRAMDNPPRIALREPNGEGADPITRPQSPEMPKRDTDSRYRLDGEIARGGMGAILKGRDTDLGRDLAIKVLLEQHKHKPEVIRRFIEEAQIGGQLQHPGIAPVYELGQFTDERPFFSMKLVKGETLSRLLADRQDQAGDRGRFIGIFEQVCQTMAYAHSRGVIHRDLKPANIMVGAFGEVQVMDWGLAKVLSAGGVADERKSIQRQQGQSIIQTLRSGVGSDVPGAVENAGSQTQVGSIMGTPAYMPPEQALGEIDNLDERADVFGLGAILCEILTGKPPYVAEDGTQVFRLASRGRLDDCMVRLNECGADDELITMTKKCLALEPADRPRDASVLAQSVTAYLESVETKLRETEMERAAEAARVVELHRRRKLLYAIAVMLTIGLLTAGFAANHFRSLERTQRQLTLEKSRLAEDARREEAAARFYASEAATQAQEARERAEAEKAAKILAQQETQRAQAATDRAEQELARSETLIYAGNMMLAQTDFETDNGGLAQHYLDQCQLHQRGWEHRYLSTRLRARQTLRGHTAGVTSVAASPDSKLIVTGSMDGTAVVWSAENGQRLRELTGHTAAVHCMAISPDGQRVVTGSEDTTAKVWDLETGEEILELTGDRSEIRTIAFSPDGKRIAIGGGISYQPYNVTVWDAQTGQQVLVIRGFDDRVLSLTYTPDGRRIVISYRNLARICDSETGEDVGVLPHDGALPSVCCLAVSPDGKHIATGCEDGMVRIWPEQDKAGARMLWGHTSSVAHLEFSPDGRYLVSGSWDQTVRLWDAATGQGILTIKGHADRVRGVTFSGAGRRIISCSLDGTAKVWEAHKGQKIVAVKDGPIGAVVDVAFSPDNRTVATCGDNGRVNVWSADTGERRITCQGHAGRVNSIAISRDGASIATGGEDKTVRIWDAATGQQIRVLDGYTSPVAFGMDGKTIATGHGDDTLRLLDSESGAERLILEGHTSLVSCVAFSPDGLHVATGSNDHTVKIWSLLTGRETQILQGHTARVTGLVFAPDGKRIVSGSDDNTAIVWDPSTGRQLHLLKGHTDQLTSVTWSPDGQRIATASFDGSVKLWETGSGMEVFSLNRHPNEVYSVAFSPDGQTLVSGTANPDNTLRVWRADDAPQENAWPLPDANMRLRFHTEQARISRREGRQFEADFHLKQCLFARADVARTERFRLLLSDDETPQDDAEREAFSLFLSSRATAYVASEQWDLAKADWLRAVTLMPDLTQAAFDQFRENERWNEAMEFGSKLLEVGPDVSFRWLHLAPVAALAGDETYRDFCLRCARHFQTTTDTGVADRAIKACLLKPGFADFETLPVEVLARGLDEGTADKGLGAWFWGTRALLAYRRGDAESAVKYIGNSEALRPMARAHLLNLALLALAEHHLGHTEKSQLAFEELSRLLLQVSSSSRHLDVDRQIAEILYREAEAKLNP